MHTVREAQLLRSRISAQDLLRVACGLAGRNNEIGRRQVFHSNSGGARRCVMITSNSKELLRGKATPALGKQRLPKSHQNPLEDLLTTKHVVTVLNLLSPRYYSAATSPKRY
jgi:hypothetical protein